MIILSVNDFACFGITVFGVTFVILIHSALTHTHARETSVMIKVLHSNLAGKIREHHDAVIGAFGGVGITQWRHTVGKVHERVHALDSAAGGRHGRRLRNGVDTHVLFATVNVSESAGDRLQKGFGIGHVVVP